MGYRIGAVLVPVALLWLLSRFLYLDPIRAGLAFVFIYGGYRLVRGGTKPAAGPRRTLVGAVHLMDRDYPWHDIDVTCGIADVKIDLSRAIIPPGEHQITIHGLVGDVAIYVPYDLDVAVAASVPVGRLTVLEAERKRFSRRRVVATGGYDAAASKVRISVSLAVGDIDVRCL